MQNAMTSNQQRIDTIEKNSLQRRMAAMKHRQAMGQRRRAALHRAVIASRGPAGFSPAEAAAVAKMRSAIQQDAANVASARTLRDNEGAAVEANLLTANKKNLACLQSKGYLSGACP